MRIAIYTIGLNEAAHVARFLASGAAADAIIVGDTGSTDGTPAALRAQGAIVHDIAIRPWRFDSARNAVLALVPPDIDICIALDLDEVLSPGWRAALEAGWPAGTTRAHYLYVWSHTQDGADDVAFWSDKIHARHGYRWRHPCHEALYPDRLTERHVYLHTLRVDHWPDPRKSRAGYLDLLQLAVAEDPHSARDAFYLAREYFNRARFDAAEAELTRYLALARTPWPEQDSIALGMAASCREVAGDHACALDLRRSAARTAPERRDAWIDLASALHRNQLWDEAYGAALRAIVVKGAPTASAPPSRAGRPDPDDLAAIAAWRTGQRRAALRHARAALERCPGDPRLAANVRLITAAQDGAPAAAPAPAPDVYINAADRNRCAIVSD